MSNDKKTLYDVKQKISSFSKMHSKNTQENCKFLLNTDIYY